jgi:hypothetical protein
VHLQASTQGMRLASPPPARSPMLLGVAAQVQAERQERFMYSGFCAVLVLVLVVVGGARGNRGVGDNYMESRQAGLGWSAGTKQHARCFAGLLLALLAAWHAGRLAGGATGPEGQQQAQAAASSCNCSSGAHLLALAVAGPDATEGVSVHVLGAGPAAGPGALLQHVAWVLRAQAAAQRAVREGGWGRWGRRCAWSEPAN